ncbi:MAG: PIN domain-containing protein [Alphaproteobacteria bacterium]
MHYIFIDYENVQPKHLTPLMDVPCKIFIFVGALQAKLPVKLVTQMQKLGDRARYIRISSSAKDALDFHIAYYIGEISAGDKQGHFHILSNDKGYDPLIEHLKSKGITVQRRSLTAKKAAPETAARPPEKLVEKVSPKTIKPAIATQKAGSKLGTAAKVAKITKILEHSQPNSEEKLINLIKNQFKSSKQVEINNLVNCLRNKKIIKGHDGDISYPSMTPLKSA